MSRTSSVTTGYSGVLYSTVGVLNVDSIDARHRLQTACTGRVSCVHTTTQQRPMR